MTSLNLRTRAPFNTSFNTLNIFCPTEQWTESEEQNLVKMWPIGGIQSHAIKQ